MIWLMSLSWFYLTIVNTYLHVKVTNYLTVCWNYYFPMLCAIWGCLFFWLVFLLKPCSSVKTHLKYHLLGNFNWKFSLIFPSPRMSVTPSNSRSVYLNYYMQLINILVCGLSDPTRVTFKHGDHVWVSEATINSLKLSVEFCMQNRTCIVLGRNII